jgi:hypothetical protein
MTARRGGRVALRERCGAVEVRQPFNHTFVHLVALKKNAIKVF